MMYLTGMVDKRTLEKFKKEAKEMNRASWFLAWILDTEISERAKGKTVEVGRASFETEKKHFTILDAPGHNKYVPNMITGAAQADLAVLVISARKNEFETGFEKGGQTREHTMLAKAAGVKFLVVLINKMDDPTVQWAEERFIECRDKLLPYLRRVGFSPGADNLAVIPCSGLTGDGLKDAVNPTICPWFEEQTSMPFIPFIENLPPLDRNFDGPFFLPIVNKYKDMGTIIMGKVESGGTQKGQALILMPNRKEVVVDQLWMGEGDEVKVNSVRSGENVKIKLKGIEVEEISLGFVLCDLKNLCKVGKIFDAKIVILDFKGIICPSYNAVMHIHCATEEISVKALICLVDKKSGEKSTTRPRFLRQDQTAIVRLECCSGAVCMETFKEFPPLGRFTLRDEGNTIAIGTVLKIVE